MKIYNSQSQSGKESIPERIFSDIPATLILMLILAAAYLVWAFAKT